MFSVSLFNIMTAYQTEYSRLEQKSVMKFLVVEMCKPYENYRRL